MTGRPTHSGTVQPTRRGFLTRVGTIGVALGLPGVTGRAVADQPIRIPTGVYRGNAGGIYYLRQVEGSQRIYWFGEAPQEEHADVACSVVAPFGNVLGGILRADVTAGTPVDGLIQAHWADVPKGVAQNWGSVELLVDNLGNSEPVKLFRESYDGTRGANTQWTQSSCDHPDENIGCVRPSPDPGELGTNLSAFQAWEQFDEVRNSRSDVTDTWVADDGGTYYVRQLPADVFGTERVIWFGERASDWSNVFWGKRDGDTIAGPWADVPKGPNRGAGTLELDVRDDGTIHRTNRTGFGGRRWKRRNAVCS